MIATTTLNEIYIAVFHQFRKKYLTLKKLSLPNDDRGKHLEEQLEFVSIDQKASHVVRKVTPQPIDDVRLVSMFCLYEL